MTTKNMANNNRAFFRRISMRLLRYLGNLWCQSLQLVTRKCGRSSMNDWNYSALLWSGELKVNMSWNLSINANTTIYLVKGRVVMFIYNLITNVPKQEFFVCKLVNIESYLWIMSATILSWSNFIWNLSELPFLKKKHSRIWILNDKYYKKLLVKQTVELSLKQYIISLVKFN